MKKKLKLFALIFAFLCVAIILMPNQVLASEDMDGVTTYKQLRTALESGKSVKLLNNIDITKTTVGADFTGNVGIKVMATQDVVIDGNGFTISGDNKTVSKIMEIYAVNTDVDVTLKNVTITNAYESGRAIDTRTGKITLNLLNSRLETTGANNTQTLTVGGPNGPVNVNITNSEIEAKNAGYGIVTFNPIKMEVQKSNITGYTALYMKAASGSEGSNGSIINVKDSELNGKNNFSGETDSFAAVVFEDGGITLNVENSKINALGTGLSSQVAFGEQVKVGNEYKTEGVSFTVANTINISDKSIVNAKDSIVRLLKNTTDVDNAKITFAKGVSSDKKIPVEFLPAGMMVKEENGVYVVSEIEVDFVVSQDKEENDKDFVVETVKTEATKETLNASLKAETNLFEKAEEAIKNGEEVNVEIKVEELKQDSIKAEEKQKITAVVSEDGKVHQYFDISVLVTANNAEIGKLTKLTDKVKLSMKLPKELIQEGRKFYILKLHDGKVEKIEAVVNGENLEFETNEFSLYALAYEDVTEDVTEDVKDETPKMGTTNMISYIWVALAIIAVVGMATTKKVARHSK